MVLEKMTMLNRRSRGAFLAAMLVILAVCMYNWIVRPHVSYLSACENYSMILSYMDGRHERLNMSVSNRRNELKKLRSQVETYENSFFTDDTAGQFFSDIQIICTQEKCKVYSLTLKNRLLTSNTDRPGLYPVTRQTADLQVVGAYAHIRNAIKRLVNRPQKVMIDSLQIELAGDSSPNIICNVLITIYVVPNKETYHHD